MPQIKRKYNKNSFSLITNKFIEVDMKNKKTQNRRKFLKQSMTGMAAAMIIPASAKSSIQSNAQEKKGKKIVYRTLGKTGLKIPVISMGTGDTDNPNLIKAALDEGITYLATSEYYGNGKNEEIVGQTIKGRKRDSVLITTSVAPDGIDHKEGLFTKESKAEPFIKKFEGSLKRLGLDYIDLFILPFAARRESIFYEPLLRAMEDIKKQGKARFIGIATHSHEPEAIRATADTKIYDAVITAYNFRKNNYMEIKESIAYAADAGIGIIAMKTMAGAYWDKKRKIPINPRAALKWVLQDENVHTTIPGFTTFDQMHQDIALMADLQLTDEEKNDLKLTSENNPIGIYCQQCGKCINQCSKSLDIPTLMRSYMYAYGYKNLAHAQSNMLNANLSDVPCSNCKSCEVKCVMGFDIKNKILDIARLKNVPEEFFV